MNPLLAVLRARPDDSSRGHRHVRARGLWDTLSQQLRGHRCGGFPWRCPRLSVRCNIKDIFPLARGLEALAWAQRPGVLKVLLDCREGD